VTCLGTDDLAHVFGHCDQKTILHARLACKMFAEPGAAAITTLYARGGILDDWSWSCFCNAYYIIMDGLGYMPQSEAHFRVQQLMCRISSRATVIKAYEDYHGSPRAHISGAHIRAKQSAPDTRLHTSYNTATGSSNREQQQQQQQQQQQVDVFQPSQFQAWPRAAVHGL
jgi:hypothetical protein